MDEGNTHELINSIFGFVDKAVDAVRESGVSDSKAIVGSLIILAIVAVASAIALLVGYIHERREPKVTENVQERVPAAHE